MHSYHQQWVLKGKIDICELFKISEVGGVLSKSEWACYHQATLFKCDPQFNHEFKQKQQRFYALSKLENKKLLGWIDVMVSWYWKWWLLLKKRLVFFLKNYVYISIWENYYFAKLPTTYQSCTHSNEHTTGMSTPSLTAVKLALDSLCLCCDSSLATNCSSSCHNIFINITVIVTGTTIMLDMLLWVIITEIDRSG